MQQINQFLKGLISDIDVSKRTSEYWTFPSMNIRVYNKKGQGFIVTYIEGSTKVDSFGIPIGSGEEFSIKSGYKILGACEYNGVIYISSYNASVSVDKGEIGCFPSPNILDFSKPNGAPGTPDAPPIGYNIQFERIYRTLRNFTNTTDPTGIETTVQRDPLNTTLFGWDIERYVDMFAAESYDGSLDFYLCDYKNPNRVVNSGFHYNTGIANNRLYWNNDFFGSLNQVQTTFADASAQFIGLLPNGDEKCGLYFLHFRYCDNNLNTTPFILESGPIQVHIGDTTTLNTVMGGEDTYNSHKQIHFKVINPDQSYQYIEVAFVRYFSDSSGVQIHETWLIDWRYPIVSGADVDILITGNEALLTITDAEIIERSLIERTCRSHTQIANYYFGGNWKSSRTDHPALVEFFKRVQVSYDDSLEKNVNTPININEPSANYIPYQDVYLTYDDVGYFRGEPYAFGGFVRLNDMQYSSAYPLRGCDQFDGQILGTTQDNYNGVYRFPRTTKSPCMSAIDRIRILRVRMDFTDALAWLQTNPTDPNVIWLRYNVKHIFLARAERKPTLKCQGVAIGGAQSYSEHFPYSTYECSYNWWDPFNSHLKTLQNIWVKADDALQIPTRWDNQDVVTHLDEVGLSGKHGQPLVKFTGAGNEAQNPFKGWADNSTNVAGNVCNPAGAANSTYMELVIPIYRAYMPMLYYNYNGGNTDWRYFSSRWFIQPKKYGVFCPDHLLNRNLDISDIEYIQRVAKTAHNFVEPNPGSYDYWFFGYPPYGFASYDDVVPYKYINEMQYGKYIDRVLPGFLSSNVVGKEDVGRDGLHRVPSYPTALGFVNETYDINDINGNNTSHQNCLLYAYDSSNKREWSTRNLRTAPFIAIEEDADIPGIVQDNYNLDIVNLYSKRPEDLNSNLATWYAVGPQLQYYKISEAIPFVNQSGNYIFPVTQLLGRGDCFLQKTFFKQATWDPSGFKGDAADSVGAGCGGTGDGFPTHFTNDTGPVFDATVSIADRVRYCHGVVLGIVTENAVNSAMRHMDNVNAYSPQFYPMAVPDWALYPLSYEGYESFLYNHGYHRQLSIDIFLGYDSNLPNTQNTIKKTRIRHSPKKVPFAYVDNYRNLQINDYKDFDLQFGQIMSIEHIEETLISIQEGAINEHYINEEALKAPTTAGELTLGLGPILSDKINILAYYGTQHQWSICKGFTGIYGWDWKKRVLWKVKAGQTAIGTRSMAVQSLSQEKMIDKWLFDFSNSINTRTDILNQLKDTPANGEGIVVGYDPENHEILFTLIKRQLSHYVWQWNTVTACFTSWMNTMGYLQSDVENLPITEYVNGMTMVSGQLYFDTDHNYIFIYYKDSGQRCHVHARAVYEDLSRTLIFNEDLDFFTSELGVNNYWYGYINRDFFSAESNRVYLHNKGPICTFNNNIFVPAQISIIINGVIGETENYSAISKLYTWVLCESQNTPFSRIDYETTYQASAAPGDTFDDFQTPINFWRNPIHHEHKWNWPVNVQTSANNDEFITGSEMRGEWIKITLTYAKRVQGWIKNIITTFISSNS